MFSDSAYAECTWLWLPWSCHPSCHKYVLPTYSRNF